MLESSIISAKLDHWKASINVESVLSAVTLETLISTGKEPVIFTE